MDVSAISPSQAARSAPSKDIPPGRSLSAEDHGQQGAAMTKTEDVATLQLPTPAASRASSPTLDSNGLITLRATAPVLPREHPVETKPSLQETASASLVEPVKSLAPGSKPVAALAILAPIPEETIRSRRKSSASRAGHPSVDEKVLKLSPAEMEELTSAPDSLPLSASITLPDHDKTLSPRLAALSLSERSAEKAPLEVPEVIVAPSIVPRSTVQTSQTSSAASYSTARPMYGSRTLSTPGTRRYESWSSESRQRSPDRRNGSVDLRHAGLHSERNRQDFSRPSTGRASEHEHEHEVPVQDIPLPPMSLPIQLQLELSSQRPSPLYIYRPADADFPYESSKIKFDRLLNFLILPPQLEQVLLFGALACLDAWLATFTILPLRFFKACAILIRWWTSVIVREARYISGFIYHGSGRMLQRQRGRSGSIDSAATSQMQSLNPSRPSMSTNPSYAFQQKGPIPDRTPDHSAAVVNGAVDRLRAESERKQKSVWSRKHHRSKSVPSALSPVHKSDLLQGLVIVASSLIMMQFDASRMYHSIRGQSAMKLYVLYNLLEVVDRLLAALGQDIFECLTSDETLARGTDGRSKILRPFGMFLLALVYNILHAAALFYQVITLNVAVNSYSNALLTLLMSNQFVEIKSTVFKKFEKENLFQLTCADVVERFQLWLMLVIIGLRNIVEVGGLTAAAPHSAEALNTTIPLRTNSILPNSFTILPAWSGEVLSPFLIVLGSEMLVDWIKHAYISKFNCVKPAVYQKYLDVLAKDYYTNAFVNQNLIKRLGLPVIPLSCLFIRASVQTYHMFLATHLPPPLPSAATALAVDGTTHSEPTAAAAALEHFDTIIRMALGRSTFGNPDGSFRPWYLVSSDDLIASFAFILFFLLAYLVALICKLCLGMLLLRFARYRYRSMKARERLSVDTKGKRLGGWGMIEVDDEKKRMIYEGDEQGWVDMKGRERRAAEKEKAAEKRGVDFERISRYEMAAKRIW